MPQPTPGSSKRHINWHNSYYQRAVGNISALGFPGRDLVWSTLSLAVSFGWPYFTTCQKTPFCWTETQEKRTEMPMRSQRDWETIAIIVFEWACLKCNDFENDAKRCQKDKPEFNWRNHTESHQNLPWTSLDRNLYPILTKDDQRIFRVSLYHLRGAPELELVASGRAFVSASGGDSEGTTGWAPEAAA